MQSRSYDLAITVETKCKEPPRILFTTGLGCRNIDGIKNLILFHPIPATML